MGDVARTAIVALSRGGAALARRLASSLPDAPKLHLDRRFAASDDEAKLFDLPLRPLIPDLWAGYRELVFFLPVGAVVRLIAPHLRGKREDPAVVCVDEAGRFAVSLVSGHLGGADRLALQVAGALGATAVVTSASEVTGALAVDLLGREFGWKISHPAPLAVTRASAAVVNGDPVGIYQAAGESSSLEENDPLPPNIRVFPSLEELAQAQCAAMLVITDQAQPRLPGGAPFPEPTPDQCLVLYRPQSLVVGMGCRRGVPWEELDSLLEKTFAEHNLALDSLACIATAELKKDEAGIIALAEKYDVPMVCYGGDELNALFPPSPVAPSAVGVPAQTPSLGPTPSPRAHSLIGVWGVSEPAALLASGSDTLLVTRRNTARATIAVARRVFGPKPSSE